MNLTDFLLARIAEDEAELAVVTGRDAILEGDRMTLSEDPDDLDVRLSPVRVLAECEARRRIVEEHPVAGWRRGSCETCTDRDYVGLVDEGPCLTLRFLALPYADHPDCREEWKP